MQLIISPTSPYARKVRIVALEKGLSKQIEELNVNPLAVDAHEAVLNPLGKVPTLVRDDGSLLFDSPVICRYFDSLSDQPRLVPLGGEALWKMERAQALGDGILDAAFSMVLEGRRTDAEQSEYWLSRWRGAIGRALAAMSSDIETAGSDFDLGHITYVCALDYLDFRLADIPWRVQHPILAAWHDHVSERPSCKSTQPDSTAVRISGAK
jgi:glutathione S-transferase